MHAVESPPALKSDQDPFATAFAVVKLAAEEHGEQIRCMDRETAQAVSVAHQRASLTVALAPEERHRHTLMARVYDRVAHAMGIMEQCAKSVRG